MANTFKGYANYGCLAAEKCAVWTAGAPQPTATVSEPVEYTVPEGWGLSESAMGDPIITAPWGWDYNPNELLLTTKEAPYFSGFDSSGNRFMVKLEWRKL